MGFEGPLAAAFRLSFYLLVCTFWKSPVVVRLRWEAVGHFQEASAAVGEASLAMRRGWERDLACPVVSLLLQGVWIFRG